MSRSGKLKSLRVLHVATLVSSLALVAGCAIKPEPLTEAELVEKAATDKALLHPAEPAAIKRPVTLSEALARAVRNNLDHRTKMLEEAQALDQTQVDKFDMMPRILANAGYVGRSDNATTTSRDSVTGLPSLANPSYSLDRNRNVDDLTLAWNVLDFGVGYYNARQNADRALIAKERRRKAMALLMQEVQHTYWRALGAQVLQAKIAATIRDANQALGEAATVEKENLRSKLESLRFQKTLLENMRQLQLADQELATAKAELAALMNIRPGTKFTLASEGLMRPGALRLDVPALEERAFLSNADNREQLYQQRIALAESRKAMIRLFPSLGVNVGKHYDSNSFLVHNSWGDAGASIGMNVISNALSAPAQMHMADDNERLTEMRRLAVRMATLAQVHVSVQQYLNAAEQFRLADQVARVDRGIADAMTTREKNDAQSAAERVANETVAITSEMRRFVTFAQMQTALARVRTTAGIDLLSEDDYGTEVDDLSRMIGKRMANLSSTVK